MCLNESYSEVHAHKNSSDVFPIPSGLKQGTLYRHCFSYLL